MNTCNFKGIGQTNFWLCWNGSTKLINPDNISKLNLLKNLVNLLSIYCKILISFSGAYSNQKGCSE